MGITKKRDVRVLKDYNRMKSIAKNFMDKKHWEQALQMIFFASGFMYTMNLIQYDSELENMVTEIAKNVITIKDEELCDKNVVLYYDSFGEVDRGLSKIYIEALIDLGYQVKYIMARYQEKTEKEMAERIGKNNIYCVHGNNFRERLVSLAEVIVEAKASTVMLYLTPDDVVAVGAFSSCITNKKCYLINQTDHAFWLGRNTCDIIINFREFGAKVCKDRREFEETEIAYLPYYPDEVRSEFRGFDFSDNNKKIIFSGGSLYKTESKDERYYELVDTILKRYSDTNYIYLGNGESRKIRQLVKRYPGRAIFATERPDFFEIMKKCTVYLSTYPYNGGLMTQYALLAGKVPVTLVCEGIDRELSIHDESSFWNYDSFESCVEEVGKLLSDDKYRQEKEKMLPFFLLKKQQFVDELQYLLHNEKSKRRIQFSQYDFDGFVRFPMENYVGLKYYRLFFRKKGFVMMKHFPKHYLLGAVGMVIEKMNKYL